VRKWQEANRNMVLWVTKDWPLLWQAAGDYHRRFKDAAVFRIGGARKELQDLAELEERPSHRATRTVAYTTLHTAQRRLPAILEGVGLVVWDECHWGEHAGAGKLITACKRKRIPMLGLTATPRENSRWTVAYSNTFEELVERGWLARPVPFVAKTNEVWTPTIDARSGDFDRASLTTLANSRKRNDQIVATYKARWSHCRRTLVFACDIQHANDLAKRFNDARCPAAAVHSDNTNEANQRARREFERGDKVILVNVAMLTHGIDIPEIETIFLCRPTKSQILFSQMVGRGARKTESKHSFSIVDFVDTLNEHGDQLVTAQRYFHGTNSASIAPRLATISQPRQARHAFDPAGAPNWIAPAADVPSSVAGLWYRTGQTFGIELEFTRPDGKIPVPTSQEWLNVAKGLLEALRQALPDRVAAKPISDYAGVESGVAKDHSVWNVEYDASAGWEVTSRILAERLGFLETAVACSALEVAARNLGVDVNYKTGLHLHLGWTTSDPAVLKRLIRLVRLFEPALATLVAASRLAAFDGVRYDLQKPNPYCRPISSVATEASLRAAHDLRGIFNLFGEHDSKFVTLNVRPLMLGNGTVEIRMHSGTYESGKVLLWTSLWQQILWAANQPVEPPKVADAERIVPTGDIVALAQQYLLDQGQAQQRGFLDKLRVRRRQVVDSWSTNWQLQGWSAAANKWP
ncbi:MAG: amidoligase family protein, partial [Deltaproteobacteria bacterium]|nr:amidoligase family protein [Deltaproteobacteria bacterium]